MKALKVAVASLFLLIIISPVAAQAAPKTTRPAVEAVTLSPKALPTRGGGVVISARVKDAQACSVRLLASQGLTVTVPKPARCAGGLWRTLVKVAGTNAKHTVTLDLVAVAQDRAVTTKVVYVGLSAPPAPAPARVVTSTPVPTTPPATPPLAVLPPAAPPVPPATTTTTTTTAPPPSTLATPPPSTTSTTTPERRATLAATYTLPATPQAPPLPVTFTYSVATSNVAAVPDGTLTFYLDATWGGCVANVGGTVTSATCTVTIPAWGSYDLSVLYDTASPFVIPTAQTITVDIEAPSTWPTTTTTTPPPPSTTTTTSPLTSTASTVPTVPTVPTVTVAYPQASDAACYNGGNTFQVTLNAATYAETAAGRQVVTSPPAQVTNVQPADDLIGPWGGIVTVSTSATGYLTLTILYPGNATYAPSSTTATLAIPTDPC